MLDGLFCFVRVADARKEVIVLLTRCVVKFILVVVSSPLSHGWLSRLATCGNEIDCYIPNWNWNWNRCRSAECLLK